jgi:flagellin
MSLSILNNIAVLYAQNNLNSTSSNLQSTLQQLSSGSRINSGADDPSGLSVADGLGANEAALTQSSVNAADGIGLLQTADGALSQVTSLLDQAVTLATEASNGTLTGGQISSANQEYQNILTQIGNIGSTTNFNSSNVFSSTATNIVVTDGTSSGLNTYADTVGLLTTASVGTSAGTAVQTNALTSANVVTTQSVAGTSKVAGKYTLTPFARTDTLAGTFAFTVGSGTETDVAITSGNLASVASQLMGSSSFTGAGLSAAVNTAGTGLVITGPTSGANAAANAVTFTNTDLADTLTPAAITATPGAGNAGTASQGQLTVAGASSGDTFSGNIVLTQGSQTLTIAITSGAFGSAATSGTVENQIAAAIAAQTNTNFAVATEGGTSSNPILKFTGANNRTPITITNTLADATTSSGVTYTAAGTAGTAPTAATYTLSALSTSTDTFGAGSVLTIGGEAIDLSGLAGSAAATAIGSDSVMIADGITASFGSNNKLVITGASNGTALPTISGLSNLTDVSSVTKPDVTTLATTTAASGTTAVPASTSVISLLNAGDTLSGTLSVVVGTGGSAKTASMTIKVGTTGAQLATQIGQNASFISAGVTASFSSQNNAITLTGPAGTTSAQGIAVTANINDSTVSVPGSGANFTPAGVSQLTAATAATILTTVTSAVADVAYQRGTIGADINELTSASNVASSEEVNLTSAQDSIDATNYGQAASNLSKFQILSQTGISALAQANSVQQEVLKLLQ